MMERVRKLNNRELREGARYVLYWSQMNRRVESNHALAFATELANRRMMRYMSLRIAVMIFCSPDRSLTVKAPWSRHA